MGDGEPKMPEIAERNTRLFVWFRVLFNCRFYYPIYLIMFLDFGLSLREFAELNAVWAIVIVPLEVPSGALADHIGRKRLINIAGVLMILELTLLCMIPVGGGAYAYWLFLANRVVSATAEAAASGADEALAYDSVSPDWREIVWPRVMGKLVRMMALGFIVVGILGGVSYSADTLNAAGRFFGVELGLTKDVTIKFPLYLNLITAGAALIVAMRMKEPGCTAADCTLGEGIKRSFSTTLDAARWILKTPAPLLLILIGVLLDGFIRLYLTVASNYWRMIGFEESIFGLFMAGFAILGFITTGLMERMVNKGSPARNFQIVSGMVLFGLAFGLALGLPMGWGVLMIIPLHLSMRFLQFFLSHYLNRVTDSSHRATVLSFKGLSMNLGYGLMVGLFAIQSWFIESKHPPAGDDEASLQAAQTSAFAEALTWWPWAFLATLIGFVAFKTVRYKKSFNSLIAIKPSNSSTEDKE